MKYFLWAIPFITFSFAYYIAHHMHNAHTFAIPSLMGQTITEAFKTLSKYNLYLRLLAEKEDADLPDGTILSQNPSGGSIVKSHQSVYCVISRKPSSIFVDNIIGMHINDIKKNYVARNIKVQTYYTPSTAPEKTCIAQLPDSGKPIKEQTIVIYVAQNCNKPIICPNLIGKKLYDVIEFLNNHAITYQINSNKHDELIDTYIVDQRPLPGSLIVLDSNNSPNNQSKNPTIQLHIENI